jgi:hypothetical protein
MERLVRSKKEFEAMGKKKRSDAIKVLSFLLKKTIAVAIVLVENGNGYFEVRGRVLSQPLF